MANRPLTQPEARRDPAFDKGEADTHDEDTVFVPPRRRRRWPWLIVALVVAAAGMGAWQTWRSSDAAPVTYATAPVERGSLEDSVSAIGTLQPLGYVDVGTQVSGQLGKLHVEIGDPVKEGDLLAEIVPTLFQSRVDADRAQLLALRAQLTDKQAQLVLARQQSDRQQRLARGNATSEDAVQSAAAVLGSAAAQVDVLKAQIQNTESTLKGDEANLSYTKIYAPMTGTVVSLTAKQGQTLNANQQAPIILRIADLLTMTITAQVSEADVGRLTTGMKTYFTTLGLGSKRWEGKLRKILPTPEVINNVVLYDALFDVPNPTGELMTQMTAQVFFVVAEAENAVLVPLAALTVPQAGRRGRPGEQNRAGVENGATAESRPAPENATGTDNRTAGENRPAGAARRPGGAATRPESAAIVGVQRSVQVLHDDGTVEQRTIRIGVSNRVLAEVLEGLKEGEKVIVGSRRTSQPPAAAPRPAPPPRLS